MGIGFKDIVGFAKHPARNIKNGYKQLNNDGSVDTVHPQLAVGGRYVEQKKLRRRHVTHVLNAYTKPDKFPKLVCFHNPTSDDGKRKDVEYWRASYNWYKEVFADPTNKVYAHCKAGVNRGPAHAYLGLLVLGLEPEKAWKVIKKARPEAKSRYVKDVNRAWKQFQKEERI